MFSPQGDECNRHTGFVDKSRTLPVPVLQVLSTQVAHRDNHPATIDELVEQCLRRPWRSRRDDDRLVGCVIRPAQ